MAGLAMDSAGYVWAVGTGPAGMPASDDAFRRAAPQGGAFLQRLAPDGSLSYLTYLGFTEATAIALDAADNIYVTGVIHTRDGVAIQHPDAFVIKLAAGGRTLVYSRNLGGSGADRGHGIAVDASGRVHVTGNTLSHDFPVTAGAARTSLGVQWFDAFYVRISPDASLLEYSSYLGGLHNDSGMAVALDAAGRAYVTGWSASGDFTLKRANNTTADPPNAFLARFSAAGLDYSTFIGGAGTDEGHGVAVSPAAVYVSGYTTSADLSGAARGCVAPCGVAAFVTKLSLDGAAIGPTTFLDGSREDTAASIAVDASDTVYVTGFSNSTDFPVTQDAAQITSGGDNDAFVAVIPMTGAAAGQPAYVSYLGGMFSEWGMAVLADRAGGAWIAGTSPSWDFPIVNAKQHADTQAWIAHFAQTGAEPPASSDIVLYARDARSITGNWQLVADNTAAANTRIWNPNTGVAKIGTAASSPANFFELTFQAEAGVEHRVWIRMKADDDHWANDSLFVQFSDGLDRAGNAVWRIGTQSAMSVSLEDCTGCGEHGWGWNDNGYDTPGQSVTFATSGTHTLRIQQREDGISVDQVVLSSRTYINAAPGAPRDDATILSPSDGGSTQPPPPPPPPPSDPREIVMYVAGERLAGGQGWLVTSDSTAAGGARLLNPNQELAKSPSPSASGSDYFEVQFTAEAGVPYHLWIRSQATNDHWQNDSVFVQFSDSVDAGGNAVWRIGSDSATYVSLEDCSGCGQQGWGWNDNAYGAFAAPIYFSKSGPQTIRVLRREDGISIDQIVLSAGRYLNASPGLAKNDTTIVPK
jgi:hypothetical protein